MASYAQSHPTQPHVFFSTSPTHAPKPTCMKMHVHVPDSQLVWTKAVPRAMTLSLPPFPPLGTPHFNLPSSLKTAKKKTLKRGALGLTSRIIKRTPMRIQKGGSTLKKVGERYKREQMTKRRGHMAKALVIFGSFLKHTHKGKETPVPRVESHCRNPTVIFDIT